LSPRDGFDFSLFFFIVPCHGVVLNFHFEIPEIVLNLLTELSLSVLLCRHPSSSSDQLKSLERLPGDDLAVTPGVEGRDSLLLFVASRFRMIVLLYRHLAAFLLVALENLLPGSGHRLLPIGASNRK
jgi:hypothetical protein